MAPVSLDREVPRIKDANLVLSTGINILLDACAIEDMMAVGLDRVLCNVMADTTDGSFDDLTRDIGVAATLQDQVGLEC